MELGKAITGRGLWFGAQAAARPAPSLGLPALCLTLFLVLFLAFALAPGAARAAQSPETARSKQAEVVLIADRDALAPGERFTVALKQTLAPHWHTYWENPGATGLPTTIVWEAPEGVEIGPIQWPTPHRLDAAGLINFGFEDEAILLAEVVLPADWPRGRPLELKAKADWLVCKDTCLPEGQLFTLSLPVAESAQTDFAAALDIARGRAAAPAKTGAAARHRVEGDRLILEIDAPAFARSGMAEHFFFPRDWRAAAPSAPQEVELREGGVTLSLQIEDQGFARPVEGVLTAVDRSGGAAALIAIDLTVPAVAAEAGAAPAPPPAAAPSGTAAVSESVAPAQETGPADAARASLGADPGGAAPADLGLGLGANVFAAAILAFLGGAILNLMPCVFPILALKAVGLARAAHAGAGAAGREGLSHGLTYAAGVLVSFLAFAAILVGLKAAGVAAGWGFQLQTPIVVALLAYVLVLVGLNLSGVFEISGAFAGMGQSLTEKQGRTGDFFTGVLAVIVAAPCTAPFMGAALGYALTQDAVTAFTVFGALGLGFAAPIVALSASPAFARLAPKPGPWMERFRQVLAFPMYLAAVWLFWVLGNQAGIDALFAALAGAVALAFAVWALGAGYPQGGAARTVAAGAAALALMGAAWALTPALQGAPAVTSVAAPADAGDGEPYDQARLAALRAEGRTVFLNVTADWCVSCKVNELNVLSGERFQQTLTAAEAVYVKGDWTRRDERITELLAGFGRIGVPLYVVFPPGGGEPVVLPQILTHDILSEALGLK